ncbi:hypothetical protein TH61_06240 [Rufibacter sp. DG15C]|uniref:FEKKY domain-containing protein n=1 Tax=Rufibacter sp. DG15C TaxID=1379909 RepID=UPI00078BCB97|nr:hypothetical protein [Rufibacter sp. DG15C]AMM50864.1 hypothetical protein TH61_06240 [Rufibacter sp. DG15C]
MRNSILTIIFLFTLTVAQAKEITAHIIFENRTAKQLTAGKFYIKELEKTLDITSTETFTVTLPEKGKYSFGFRADEFEAYTMYPARITENNNIITIRLEAKYSKIVPKIEMLTPVITHLTNEQLDALVTRGEVNFIFHCLYKLNLDFTAFRATYGVGYTAKNCVIDPVTLKYTSEHNKRLEEYLTQKYGEGWKQDLPAHPLGIK